jgi:hypothetical protein
VHRSECRVPGEETKAPLLCAFGCRVRIRCPYACMHRMRTRCFAVQVRASRDQIEEQALKAAQKVEDAKLAKLQRQYLESCVLRMAERQKASARRQAQDLGHTLSRQQVAWTKRATTADARCRPFSFASRPLSPRSSPRSPRTIGTPVSSAGRQPVPPLLRYSLPPQETLHAVQATYGGTRPRLVAKVVLSPRHRLQPIT